MNNTKHSFVVLLEFVKLTLEDISDHNVTLVPEESDLELGYFTVQGTPDSVSEFIEFLNCI